MQAIVDLFTSLIQLIFVVALILAVVAVWGYNSLRKLAENVKEAQSNVDIALRKKVSLINRLTEMANQYREGEKLVMLTNTPGVLDEAGKLLTGVTPRQIDEMVASGTLSGGMLPKISSALEAARSGVKTVHIIDGRVPHALLLEVLTDQGVGTLIRSK